MFTNPSSNPGAPSSINFTTEGPLTLRRAVEQCSCHSHPRDSSGSKAPKPPKPPSNVNPGLINPKRLFDWGGTIWVLDYHYLGSTPLINKPWFSKIQGWHYILSQDGSFDAAKQNGTAMESLLSSANGEVPWMLTRNNCHDFLIAQVGHDDK